MDTKRDAGRSRPPSPSERLRALRRELTRRGLDGLVVPRADEHQGEYVPACAERLAWITGFTGSAGLAVVLADQAVLFVDGRYTLQAGAEADPDLFDVRPITGDPGTWPPGDWLSRHLPEDARLGYDPWLHTRADVGRLRRSCETAGARLVACDDNPVDAAWTDRPPPPAAPVMPHDAALAGADSSDKRARIAGILRRERLDAAVLTAPDSIAWLLNVRGGDVPYTPLPLSFAVIHVDGSVDWLVEPAKLTDDVRAGLGQGVRTAPPAQLGPLLDRLGGEGRTVRASESGAPSWVLDRLEGAGARLAPGEDPCLRPKAVKTPTELDGMRAAHRRDGAALARFLAWFADAAPAGGLTEMAAAERLEAFRAENDRFRGLSFPTISAAGPNGAIVHYRVSEASNRAIETGTLYLVDSGAQYLDGTTDVTRTVAVGGASEEMRERFTRVLKGHIALARARFPEGTTGHQLDAMARAPLWAAGLDYDHGTGHGVGSYLGVHEGPQRISKAASPVALEPGMVLSNEPGYYKEGAYGIRIENLVAVTGVEAPEGAERRLLGFETLTLAPIDRHLIRPDLLDAGETAWLDAYHALVRAELTPLVDDATARWLAAATAPLGR